jgi:hypothetical protein
MSALIQATAIAWALAMTILVFIHEYNRRGYHPDSSDLEEEVKLERAPTNLRLLGFMNITSFLTVLWGVLALATIHEPFEIGFTFSTISILLTVVFSITIFLLMTFTIRGILRHWTT